MKQDENQPIVTQKIEQTEIQNIEELLADEAREISRGRIHDMPRWME